jgi:hypothetical protein
MQSIEGMPTRSDGFAFYSMEMAKLSFHAKVRRRKKSRAGKKDSRMHGKAKSADKSGNSPTVQIPDPVNPALVKNETWARPI